MAFFKTVCGMSLRKGTIITGILSIIGTIFTMVRLSVEISSFYSIESKLKTWGKRDGQDFLGDLDYAAFFVSFLNLVMGLEVVMSLFNLLISCLLTYGACKGRKMLFLPWMACQFVGTISTFVVLIIWFWFMSHFGFIAGGFIFIFAFITGIFFQLVVYSHFEELMDKDKLVQPPEYSTTFVCNPGLAIPQANFGVLDNKGFPV